MHAVAAATLLVVAADCVEGGLKGRITYCITLTLTQISKFYIKREITILCLQNVGLNYMVKKPYLDKNRTTVMW